VGASTKTVSGGLKTLALLDVAMVTYSINYREEEPVLDQAARDKKGIFLKKILGSGFAPDQKTAIQFAMGHPGVSAGIIGTINAQHLRQNVMALQESPIGSAA
jgi:aryl-alcohol dehydrogenase-like predicted oxidoreductase